MNIGDIVIYTGMVRTTSFTSDTLFDHITLYKEYRVLSIMDACLEKTVYILIEHDNGYGWYPIENFELVNRNYFKNKYGLK